jgi:DNA-binding MarR family transcriptional regulator
VLVPGAEDGDEPLRVDDRDGGAGHQSPPAAGAADGLGGTKPLPSLYNTRPEPTKTSRKTASQAPQPGAGVGQQPGVEAFTPRETRQRQEPRPARLVRGGNRTPQCLVKRNLFERAKAASLAGMKVASRSPGGRGSKAFDSLEQEAYLQLWRTYDRLREIDETVFHARDITAQQYNALRVLRSVRPEALSTSTLGARLVSRAPDMTRLLDRLEAQGFVKRRRSDENRRVVCVSITAAGVALIDELAVDVRRCGRRQLGHLGREALEKLIALLQKARQPHEDRSSADDWPGNRR